MVLSELIALGGLILAGISGCVAAGKFILSNSLENTRRLTQIADALNSNHQDLAEIKDDMKELRSEQKIHVARLEAMEREAKDDRFSERQRHEELRASVRDLWQILAQAHPDLVKRRSDFFGKD